MFHRSLLTNRVFFALRPPPPLARQVADSGFCSVPAERLHMTMFILDDIPWLARRLVELLLMIGEQVRAAPVDIRLDRIISSLSLAALRPARANALRALHCQISDLARVAGIAERQDYRFART